MITPSAISLFQPEYLSVLLGSIDESVVATDPNFLIQYWNKGAESIFGYKAAEVIGKPSVNILKFIYTHSWEAARKELVQKGRWKGMVHYKTSEGKLVTIDASVKVAKDEFGKIIGYVGVYRDITDYDRNKADLATFLSIISSLDDTFFVVDKKLKLVFIDDKTNKKIKNNFGLEYDVGDDILKLLPANRRKAVQGFIKKAFSGERNSYEMRIESETGKSICLQSSYFPVKNKDGYITHVCILMRDVTAQKQLDQFKEKLYKSRQLFETFMENSPILAWVVDARGTISYLNPAYLKMYSLSKTAIGKSVLQLFPGYADVFRKNDLIVLETRQSLQTIEKLTTPDGKEHIYQVMKFPVIPDDELYVGGWALDITEEELLKQSLTNSLHQLQQSEQDLKKALLKEHQLNDMKSRFVSMASHEFRTPLSTMLSSSYLIEKYTEAEQQANRVKHVTRIKEAIHHMNALLEDFLSLGKLEEGKTALTITPFSVEELIQNAVEELEPLKKQGQSIQIKFKGEDEINTDKRLLKNIIINILSNAIKFSGEDQKILFTAIITKTTLRLVIKDHGIGIGKEDQEHLFQSFYRARNAQNIQGTGLGLHIVRRYLAILNGDIHLESVLNKGTTVTVIIPI